MDYLIQSGGFERVGESVAAISYLARTPGQFSEALRRYRLSRGWSQTQLAQHVGLRQATISQIENGHAATRIDTLCAVLAALDLN